MTERVADTWQDRMPRSVLDLYCASDHVVTTPTDRRMLWHIECLLAVAATNDTLQQLAQDLRRYLNATCGHHWHEYEAEVDIPAHRQCVWCSDIQWLDVGEGDPDAP